MLLVSPAGINAKKAEVISRTDRVYLFLSVDFQKKSHMRVSNNPKENINPF